MEIKKSQKNSQNYVCDICNYNTSRRQDFINHNLTLKHKKQEIEKNGNLAEIQKSRNENSYNCLECNYCTLKKRDFDKHMNTLKHIKIVNENSENKTEIVHNCGMCSKEFKNASGLWKHKQKCKPISEEQNLSKHVNKVTNNTIIDNTFIEFMKQSKEFQQFLYEQNKELQNTLIEKTNEFQNTVIEQNNKMLELSKNHSIITNSNNTTNQQFNIQLFLNETCKDAMNIMDFVNSLQLQIEDFEETGRLGYVEGISRIIIKGLKSIDTTKRPIHCTDVKRETLYIKNDNSWEKEDQDKGKLKQAVTQVARMNLCQLPKWQQLNPESAIIDTKQNEEYVQYSIAALGGRTDEEDNKYMDKIMKNVLKEVVVDKNNKKL